MSQMCDNGPPMCVHGLPWVLESWHANGCRGGACGRQRAQVLKVSVGEVVVLHSGPGSLWMEGKMC